MAWWWPWEKRERINIVRRSVPRLVRMSCRVNASPCSKKVSVSVITSRMDPMARSIIFTFPSKKFLRRSMARKARRGRVLALTAISKKDMEGVSV
jgi:hypothetical protein